MGALVAHALLVFGIGGFSSTSWITFSGLAVIDGVLCLMGAVGFP